MAPEFASTGSGVEKIQDKIARNLSSLKQMEERAFAARQQESIDDISTSILKQMKEYLGDIQPDFEELLSNNTKLSHMTEQVRMGTSHVLSGVSDSLERLGIPSDAQEAFVWMEFKECFVDVDNEIDAKFAFPMANETANEAVCVHCRTSRRTSRGSGDEKLFQCTSKHNRRFTWTCPNHFHLSCRMHAISHIKADRQRLEDRAVDKTTMFCCLGCLGNAESKRKKKFRAVKLFRAASVELPSDLKFCEFYASISPEKSEAVLTCVKPGVFPFLRFGGHHSKMINSAGWHCIDYWTYSDPTFPSQFKCALVKQDRPNGSMWTFSGEIQPLRCARVGVLTSDTLRKCGLKDSSLAALGAAELMKKMRQFHMNCSPAPEKKWEILCVKKLQFLTMALATDNGDIIVASIAAPLSGFQPDTTEIPTRTLTVQRDDAQRCAAERVAWNCDGTVLAASCQDHRIVTWEKARDIEAHPEDGIDGRRNAKKGTCEWICDGPIVSLCWSPVNAHQFLVATARSCFIMRFESGSTCSPAVIAVGSVHGASSDITCATFGSSGRYIAVGTQSSGWFAIDSSDSHLSSCDYNFPLGGIVTPVLAICGLHAVKSAALYGDTVVDGRDFAVATRVASDSILHIWKYSEFKCNYQVIKEIHLPSSGGSSAIVTSLLCSRDSEKDPDSFKILALNGSSTGYLINYLGSCCYDSYVKPVEFWCPVEQKPVNVSRAAWGHMARTIAFCDFSCTSKEVGGFWLGLPRLYELWRAQTDAPHSISNPFQGNSRRTFNQALTCDLSVHSVVREDAGNDGAGSTCFGKVWNHDVELHQQLVNDAAQFWKEFAKARNISGEVAEKVVQEIVVQKFQPYSQTFLICASSIFVVCCFTVFFVAVLSCDALLQRVVRDRLLVPANRSNLRVFTRSSRL